MILVIGGKFSGKREYTKELGFCDDDFSSDIFSDKPVLFDLQDFTGDLTKDVIEKLLLKKVIISDETGSGIVPVDKELRLQREKTGELLQLLAQKSEKVIRVCCSIGTKIKG